MEDKELLKQYRDQIDTIDGEMVYLLSRRLEIVRQIGELKKREKIPPLQPKRWNEILKLLKEEAREREIPEQLIEDLWNRIHEESLKIEK